MTYALSERDEHFVSELASALRPGVSRETLAKAVTPIIERYRTVPINGLIRSVVTDLECHLGLFQSNMFDHAPIDDALTFEGGLVGLVQSLEGVLKSVEPPQYYRRFIRWIQYGEHRIEVRELASMSFHFSLLQAIDSGDYYFWLLKNHSAAYYDVVVKVSEDKKGRVASAVARADTASLGKIADTL